MELLGSPDPPASACDKVVKLEDLESTCKCVYFCVYVDHMHMHTTRTHTYAHTHTRHVLPQRVIVWDDEAFHGFVSPHYFGSFV